MVDGTYDNARSIAIRVFEQQQALGVAFAEALDAAITTIAGLPIFPGLNIEALREDIRQSVTITIDPPSRLVGDAERLDWLPERRAGIDWRYWRRYRSYLLDEKQMPPSIVDRLDRVTDDVLGLLGDPSAVGESFDIRGMVVGNVQSGKTMNYSALVNKALDAGYKLIIVLAGMHNNLRSQTQERLDEEVLGVDTARSALTANSQTRFGVGLVRTPTFFFPGFLTTRLERGDFQVRTARAVGVPIGDSLPFTLVVKKNGTVLRALLRYLRDDQPHAVRDPVSGRRRVVNVPLLLIDDEADQASIDTRDNTDGEGNLIDDTDPTTINRLIRDLLHSFEQSSYVGYTATPFANIFIHQEARHREFGDDLFPRDFVYTLRPPSNYIGPRQLLGVGSEDDEQPVFRTVWDADAFVPAGHKKTHRPAALPDSLKEAIRAFLLSAAARRARGHRNEHHSMLIHVTRFTAVQARVDELVEAELGEIRSRLRYGDGQGDSLRAELKTLWQRDFEPTSRQMGCQPPDWHAVSRELERLATEASVRSINGTSADILDYREKQATGITTLVVGGDKLSRGLTLEGLCVSYFLRTSHMYDTLMQMGRWFGYRPGYEDLCRIYLTAELRSWFRHIAEADDELREEFEHMARSNRTPREYGLRVRSHPVLTVTSSLKMRHARELHLSFGGTVSETVRLHRSATILAEHVAAADDLIGALGPGEPRGDQSGAVLWREIESWRVLQFLRRYRTPEANRKFQADRAREYIERQNQDAGELVRWTIALVGQPPGSASGRDVTIGGVTLACLERQIDELESDYFTIRRLLSPPHEAWDLSEAQIASALAKTRDDARRRGAMIEPDRPSGPSLRAERPTTHGFLLLYPLRPKPPTDSPDPGEDLTSGSYPPLGVGISWPKSDSPVTVPYMVTPLFLELET